MFGSGLHQQRLRFVKDRSIGLRIQGRVPPWTTRDYMKKRILFVDDDPLVLQGMERAFRRMRAEWDMVFAESAEQALGLMAQEPFDVVVSDMHMPAMNGPALLTEVMQRYPKTVRLILSGTADQELIM